MSTTLFFTMDKVATLVEHAQNATEFKPTASQLYDEDMQVIENLIIPPGLILVRDGGIYLISNGVMEKEQTPISSGLISYAHGFDPKKNPYWYEQSRIAVGGDDFAIDIEIDDFFRNELNRKEGFLYIELTPGFIQLGWTSSIFEAGR